MAEQAMIDALTTAKTCIESTCKLLAEGAITDVKLGCIAFASNQTVRRIDEALARATLTKGGTDHDDR